MHNRCLTDPDILVYIVVEVLSLARGYKTFLMLNSVEHEFFPANCWHFNIY